MILISAGLQRKLTKICRFFSQLPRSLERKSERGLCFIKFSEQQQALLRSARGSRETRRRRNAASDLKFSLSSRCHFPPDFLKFWCEFWMIFFFFFFARTLAQRKCWCAFGRYRAFNSWTTILWDCPRLLLDSRSTDLAGKDRVDGMANWQSWPCGPPQHGCFTSRI